MTSEQGHDDAGRFDEDGHSEPEASLPNHWKQGEEAIDRMIASGDLERIGPSTEHADRLFAEARQHLMSAERISVDDPTAAYVLLYDAARKSLAAILAAQGLRSTSKGGGHAILQEAVAEQLGRTKVILRPMSRIRSTRHSADYPVADGPPIVVEDVEDDLPIARSIVESMSKFLPNLGPF